MPYIAGQAQAAWEPSVTTNFCFIFLYIIFKISNFPFFRIVRQAERTQCQCPFPNFRSIFETLRIECILTPRFVNHHVYCTYYYFLLFDYRSSANVFGAKLRDRRSTLTSEFLTLCIYKLRPLWRRAASHKRRRQHAIPLPTLLYAGYAVKYVQIYIYLHFQCDIIT